MLPEGGGFDEYVIKRFAKGIVSAVHLIHRGAVPLPRKDRVESEEWRVEINARLLKHTFEYRAPLLTIDY